MPSRVGAWRVIRVATDRNVHPRIQAKRFKILSQKIFPKGKLAFRYAPFSSRPLFDLSIWIDAGCQIKCTAFVKDMRELVGRADWAMFIHPARDCIYDEARVSLSMPKYKNLPISQQVKSYRAVVPPHSGLYACTVIVRLT
jgi:hypothetical protein